MTALDGAFALAEHFHVAVMVADDLELDVARRFDELLDVDVGAGERRAGFALRLREIGCKFRGVAHDPHAASATAGRRFDDDGIADLLGQLRAPPRATSTMPSRSRQDRHAGLFIASRARCFSPIVRITSGLGPMNVMPDASQTSAKSAFSLRKP